MAAGVQILLESSRVSILVVVKLVLLGNCFLLMNETHQITHYSINYSIMYRYVMVLGTVG